MNDAKRVIVSVYSMSVVSAIFSPLQYTLKPFTAGSDEREAEDFLTAVPHPSTPYILSGFTILDATAFKVPISANFACEGLSTSSDAIAEMNMLYLAYAGFSVERFSQLTPPVRLILAPPSTSGPSSRIIADFPPGIVPE